MAPDAESSVAWILPVPCRPAYAPVPFFKTKRPFTSEVVAPVGLIPPLNWRMNVPSDAVTTLRPCTTWPVFLPFPLPLPVIFVVCTTVPDLPLRTARSEVDVHVPVAVVALVKCIVKVSDIACGFDAWAASGKATAATVARAASVSFVFTGYSPGGGGERCRCAPLVVALDYGLRTKYCFAVPASTVVPFAA